MRRDWPLFAAGLGIVVLSAAVAIPAILAYRPDDPTCSPPKPPAVMIDGCYRANGGFNVWITHPGVIVTLAIAFVLLLVAVATMRRGLASRAPERP